MYQLFVGVCHVSLIFRHAQSLKDRRQVLSSLKQKLKNQGFSVVETSESENPKRGALGFSFTGKSHAHVEKVMADARELFYGPFEVAQVEKGIFDYSFDRDKEESIVPINDN